MDYYLRSDKNGYQLSLQPIHDYLLSGNQFLSDKGGSCSGEDRFKIILTSIILVIAIPLVRYMIRIYNRINHIKIKTKTKIKNKNKTFVFIMNVDGKDKYNVPIRYATFSSLESIMTQYENVMKAAQDHKPKHLKIKGMNKLNSSQKEYIENLDIQFVEDLGTNHMRTQPFFSLERDEDKTLSILRFKFLRNGNNLGSSILSERIKFYVEDLRHHLKGIGSRFDLILNKGYDQNNIRRFIYLSLPDLLPTGSVKVSDFTSINGIRNGDYILKDIENMPPKKENQCRLTYALPSDPKVYKESDLNPQGITILRNLITDIYQNALEGNQGFLINYYWIDNEFLREGIDPNESESKAREREEGIKTYVNSMRDINYNDQLFGLEEDVKNPLILRFDYMGKNGSEREINLAKKHLDLIRDGYEMGINHNYISNDNERRETVRHDSYNQMDSILNQIDDDLDNMIEKIRDDDPVSNRKIIYNDEEEISVEIQLDSFKILERIMFRFQFNIQQPEDGYDNFICYWDNGKLKLKKKDSQESEDENKDESRRIIANKLYNRLIHEPCSEKFLFHMGPLGSKNFQLRYEGTDREKDRQVALIQLGFVLELFDLHNYGNPNKTDSNELHRFFDNIRSHSFKDVINFTGNRYRNSLTFVTGFDDEVSYVIDQLSDHCLRLGDELMLEYNMLINNKGGEIESKTYYFDNEASLKNDRMDNENDTIYMMRKSFDSGINNKFRAGFKGKPLFILTKDKDKSLLKYQGSEDNDGDFKTARMQIKGMSKKLKYGNKDNPYGIDRVNNDNLLKYMEGFLLNRGKSHDNESKDDHEEDDIAPDLNAQMIKDDHDDREDGNDPRDQELEESDRLKLDDDNHRLIFDLPYGKDSKDKGIILGKFDTIDLTLTMEDYRGRIKGKRAYLLYDQHDKVKHESLYSTFERAESTLGSLGKNMSILFELKNDEKDPSVLRFNCLDLDKDYRTIEAHLGGIESGYGIVKSFNDSSTNKVNEFISTVRERLSKDTHASYDSANDQIPTILKINKLLTEMNTFENDSMGNAIASQQVQLPHDANINVHSDSKMATIDGNDRPFIGTGIYGYSVSFDKLTINEGDT